MTNEEAIKELELMRKFNYTLAPMKVFDLAIKALEERPKGKWIEHSTYKDVLICSHCHHGSNQFYDTFKFCPNCGSNNGGDV